ncbi:Trk system potassium uptake protein TrkA [Bathymodiolus thermophilus thioautotrophic gill symbiont]|uniref:Trk system potassium uptake protein TrkA n=1 Tax=Bathymodiolus thermophilus thioautotrophic gill symbiont TaxID=2360 RepID=A0A1J5UME8_9GAMM|nr:Trk system potassium transporter TrkA [Bathymodiolus thermophilus thioautotrophic gill symbiont]AYQ57191.1 potassium transporter peripheral membrane protein [Bathymodiolus thermophilus thioautotrophic gill symbiont]OIR25407.1 Trk system potassium transport protein TrkA [Bathymodiolus thermophilus thioautotrophic gill symbiont]CAB5500364.1 Trk potassium uptake system protein TrkA [Bathymodiolus thermophilus thioautotrophic gill symbiont]CAB5505411.1 Trk potassium uptake system protein TrkA [B
MKILILGAGQVGASLARYLSRDTENDITIVDKDEVNLSDIARHLDVKTICGHGSYPNILEQAEIRSMDMLIAVTKSDEGNMLACQMAHTLYNVGKKIARIRTAEYLYHDKLFSDYAIPIDFVITPEVLVTNFIKRMVEQPGAEQIFEFDNGLIQLVETKAYKGTPIVGRPIKELHEHLPKTRVRIVAIYRNGEAIPAYGDTVIKDGDRVYFVTKKGSVAEVLKEFRRLDRPYKNIIIAGGGLIGLNLAKFLEKNHRVRIIELNKQRVKEIADELEDTIVLHGNASDQDLLTEEGIESTDLFLALTDSDEINVIVSILAKRLGAHKTVALVKRNVYKDLATQSDGVDMVISPDQITTSGILSHIRKGDTMMVHSLRQGKAEAIEVIVHGDKSHSDVIGKSIEEIKLPEGAVFASVVRGDEVIMASRTLVIQENDHVLLVLSDVNKIHQIEELFEGYFD